MLMAVYAASIKEVHAISNTATAAVRWNNTFRLRLLTLLEWKQRSFHYTHSKNSKKFKQLVISCSISP